MKKFLFLYTATFLLVSAALTGCGVKNDDGKSTEIPAENLHEQTDDTTEDKNSEENNFGGGFKFIPRDLGGSAVGFYGEFDGGEIFIIKFGKNRKHKDGIFPRPPEKPNVPEDNLNDN